MLPKGVILWILLNEDFGIKNDVTHCCAVMLIVILLAIAVYFLPRTAETTGEADDILITAFENSGAVFFRCDSTELGNLRCHSQNFG